MKCLMIVLLLTAGSAHAQLLSDDVRPMGPQDIIEMCNDSRMNAPDANVEKDMEDVGISQRYARNFMRDFKRFCALSDKERNACVVTAHITYDNPLSVDWNTCGNKPSTAKKKDGKK